MNNNIDDSHDYGYQDMLRVKEEIDNICRLEKSKMLDEKRKQQLLQQLQHMRHIGDHIDRVWRSTADPFDVMLGRNGI